MEEKLLGKTTIVLPFGKDVKNNFNQVTKKTLDSKKEEKSAKKSTITTQKGEVFRPEMTVGDWKADNSGGVDQTPLFSDIYIEGIASGAALDLDGERMLESAIISMNDSFKDYKDGMIPLRAAHTYEFNGIIGAVTELFVHRDENDILSLGYKAVFLNPEASGGAKDALLAIDMGTLLGVSIGADILEGAYGADPDNHSGVSYQYAKLKITEISVTSFPAYSLSTLNLVKELKKSYTNVEENKSNIAPMAEKTKPLDQETDATTEKATEEAKEEATTKTATAEVEVETAATEEAKTEEAPVTDNQDNGEEVVKSNKETETETKTEVTKAEAKVEVETTDNPEAETTTKNVVADELKVDNYAKRRLLFAPIKTLVDMAEDAFLYQYDRAEELMFEELKTDLIEVLQSIPNDLAFVKSTGEGLYAAIKVAKQISGKTATTEESVVKTETKEATPKDERIEYLEKTVKEMASSPQARVAATVAKTEAVKKTTIFGCDTKEAAELVVKNSSYAPMVKAQKMQSVQNFFA